MDAHGHFKSLAAEITAVKDRVQNLIGRAHWDSVGESKESVLRSILRRHFPSSLRVGSSFDISEYGQSNQIDVLIYDETGPLLFRDGDLVIATPDVVRGVIEVKTKDQKLPAPARWPSDSHVDHGGSWNTVDYPARSS